MRGRRGLAGIALALGLLADTQAAVEVEGHQVTFSLHAPEASAAWVAGSWAGWVNVVASGEAVAEPFRMRRDGDGRWRLTVSVTQPGSHEYRFILDGTWMEDPENSHQVVNEYGSLNSVFVVAEEPSPPRAPSSALPAGDASLRLRAFDQRRGVPLGRFIASVEGPRRAVLTSDMQGLLALEGIPAGDYRLTVVRTCYEPRTVTVRVQPSAEEEAVSLAPQRGPTVSFWYNEHSPRRKEPAGVTSAVTVCGEFNRWQPGLALSDPEGDGLWQGTVEMPDTVVESDYRFAVTVSGEVHSVPDPESDFATELNAADSHFRRWPDSEPVLVIRNVHPGRVTYAFAPPREDCPLGGAGTMPEELQLIINGRAQGVEPRSDGVVSLPPLPEGEVSITLRGRALDGRWAQDAATVWQGPTETTDPRFEDSTPSTVPGPPAWLPDASIYQVLVRSFGDSDGDGIGDFNGLAARLDHIVDMGFNTLLLMPVWDGPSEHGYTPRSLWRVEEDYGTDEDLRRLIEACHVRGLRVILDYNDTTTYTGHPLLGPTVRQASSPFHDWILWIDDTHYQAYTLGGDVFNGGWPQFNYANPAVRQHMVSMLDHWATEFGVDGYRFDSAERLQPAPNWDWWRIVRRELKARHPDLVLLGEVYGADRSWYDNRLDIGYDMPLVEVLRHATASGASVEDLARLLAERTATDPTGASFLRFLDSHDHDRLLTAVGGDADRARLGLAALLTLTGVPSVWYGCELGMAGGGIWGPNENRRFMAWEAGDEQTHSLVRTLGRLRAAEPTLRNSGTCELLATPHADEMLLILRRSRAVPRSDDFALAFNFGETPKSIDLPAGAWHLEVSSDTPAVPLRAHGFAVWRGRVSAGSGASR